jgi:hypothetical protein
MGNRLTDEEFDELLLEFSAKLTPDIGKLLNILAEDREVIEDRTKDVIHLSEEVERLQHHRCMIFESCGGCEWECYDENDKRTCVKRMYDSLSEDRDKYKALVLDGIEAVRFTREYVGEELLPAIEGWSWFDWLVAAEKAVKP